MNGDSAPTRRATIGCVDEGSGDLAIVFGAQRTAADPAAGANGDAVGKAAVGFDNREQALVGLREIQAKEGAGPLAHAHAQHLARAQVAVQRSRFLKQFGYSSN